jgi:hypothetical protein
MSHTDKDDPLLIQARGGSQVRRIHVFCGARDLPTATSWRACDGSCEREGRQGGCEFWSYGSVALPSGPSPEACHLLFYGPERASTRDTLRAARRDYNTHGDTDIEPFPRQHRRGLRERW